MFKLEELKFVLNGYCLLFSYMVRKGDFLFLCVNIVDFVGVIVIVECDVKNLVFFDKIWCIFWYE